MRGVGDKYLNVEIKYPNLIGFDEEIIELSEGILRLIDFNSMSSTNSTSILYPLNYKPSLK
jgi:hypothetical protein